MVEPVRNVDDDIDELELLTRPGREEDLRIFLLLLHPADVADLLDDVNEKTALAILRHLDPERAAILVSELDGEDAERILRLIKPEELGGIVAEMKTDDAADLIQELDEATANQVLASLPAEDQDDVRQLLSYDRESAGGIMQTELVAIPLGATVQSALEAVRETAGEIDIISCFVIDDTGHYAGHVALQNLVLSAPETSIERVMEPKVVEIQPDVDQEEVARLFDRYSLVELGVVNDAGILIGRITADDVHEVLVEEAEEDMLKMVGIAAETEVIYSGKVGKIVWQRLPWLGSTFLAGLIATWILHTASVVFETAVILLMFVPVITGMSRNVGTQSAMIMIRGMAVGHIEKEDLVQGVIKDALVSSIMAAVCGVAVTAIVTAWQHNIALGLCVGVALSLSMMTSSFLGSTEPAILTRFGIDPAVAAGPLITSINDISGVLIYTGVSVIFLEHLG